MTNSERTVGDLSPDKTLPGEGKVRVVLVCGDRAWTDYDLIKNTLAALPEPPFMVIEGGATGADSLAFRAATELGLACREYPADWKNFGKAAGPLRNRQMLEEGQPDLVIAFHDHFERSKGTADMVARAVRAGVRVLMVTHSGSSEIPSLSGVR